MAIPRIDEELVSRGLADTIERARLLVMEGRVYLGGGKVAKPSDKAKPGLALTVRDPALPFVSRGALKLQKALASFDISVRDRVCMDLGASTGGFTDILLKSGAKRVYAVDVGFGLLHWSLRKDPRVIVMERTNARHIKPDMFDPSPSLGVTDVSFISLRAVLPGAFSVLKGPGRRFVALVKPQFEAPREQVGEGGVVRDVNVHRQVLSFVAQEAEKLNWVCQAVDFSPIKGAQGNIEFLMDLVPKDEARARAGEAEFDQAVEAAHRAPM